MENYEVGGKISVTLRDGTKIADSPIYSPDHLSARYIANGYIRLLELQGVLSESIARVDRYTPPAPAWAAENVRIIQSMSLGFVKAYRDTLDGSPLLDYWVTSDGENFCSALELQEKADDWEIYGVAP